MTLPVDIIKDPPERSLGGNLRKHYLGGEKAGQGKKDVVGSQGGPVHVETPELTNKLSLTACPACLGKEGPGCTAGTASSPRGEEVKVGGTP